MKLKRGKSDSSDVSPKKKFKKSVNFANKGAKNKGKKGKGPKFEKSGIKHKNVSGKKSKNQKNSKGKSNKDKPKQNEKAAPITDQSKQNGKSNENQVPNKIKKTKNPNFSKGKPNMDKIKYSKKGENEKDTTGEKPNWLEYKKEQKELREKRRARKLDEAYEVAKQAKQIGEKLRRISLSADMQGKLTKKMHDLVKTQYAKMIFAHDLSRVIQWQIKYCNEDIRLEIVEELRPYLREMFYSKYAKNVIRTLLKRGSTSVKKILLSVCGGHVVKLLTSVISAPLFEKIYVEIASDAEKISLKQEFYGDLYKNSKDPSVKTLIDVYKNSEVMKTATLSAVKSNLTKILNKNLINSTLVHTVLYEFLTNCSKEDKIETMALVRPLIAELSQTKDGTKVANLCIWHGTNKDRKLIMKTLKEHVKDIMTSEHGHLMILALLDCVDDTVLLKKILLQEVLNNLNDIVSNEYGRRVILYIVARRDTHYFHPTLIKYLQEGDGNETTKKPAEIREKELLDNVIDNLLASVTSDVKMWLTPGPIQIVTLAILNASHGTKSKPTFTAIAEFITDINSELQKDAQSFKAIEEPGLHMILKKLIQMDGKRIQENDELTFGEVLLKHLSSEVLGNWVNYNRGCFLLVLMLENESEDIISELKSKLCKITNLESKKTQGARILLGKLNLNLSK